MPAAPQSSGQCQHLCCGSTNAPDALQLSSKGLGSSKPRVPPCLLVLLLLLSTSQLLPLLLLQTCLLLAALLLPQVRLACASSCCGGTWAPAGITAAAAAGSRLDLCSHIALRWLLLLWLWLWPWG